jgi:uncharacterized Zn finger protein (UPF0148 family)
MSKPEIFRRCLSCGASFRAGALFCPQCGTATTVRQAEESDSSSDEATLPEKAEEDPTNQSNTPQPQEDVAAAPANESATTLATNQPNSTARLSESRAPLTAKLPDGSAGERSESIGGRAATNMERRIRPRVDKLRKGTSVVIDEAASDSSLRFILIALLLFLLSLFLLLLSKWLG